MWFGVRTEELRVELREDIANSVCLVRELHAEEGFKKVEECGRDFGLEGGHVGEGQEQPD